MARIKISLLLTALLPILFGCRVNERAFDGTTVYGDLSAEYAKWESDDTIGVWCMYNGNNPFGVTAETASTKNGTFKGSLSAEPTAAYFPYSKAVQSSASENISLTLPDKQVSGAAPNMSMDVRVCGKPDGSTKDGFTFKFTHKLALIRFELVPDSELDGHLLSDIALYSSGRKLAGNFKMSILDASKALTFSDNIDEVEISFEQTPQLKQGEKVYGWMFINPDIVKDDPLSITITTDQITLVAELIAESPYQTGVINGITLDIAALKNAGKIYEKKGEGTVFEKLTKFGYFDLSKRIIKGIITYEEGVDQYGLYSNNTYYYYSITNINRGYATKVSFSKKDLDQIGKEFDLQTTSAGISVVDGHYTATLVKASGDTLWFKDDTNHLGFILSK